MDDLVTIRELSDRLSVPIEWLMKQVRAGRLPHLKAGRQILLSFGVAKSALAKMAAAAAEAESGVANATN